MERLRDSERSRLIRRQRARSGSGSVGTMWVMRNAEQPMGRRSASHVTSLLLYISCSTGAEKNAGRCEASPATTSLAACPLFAMDRSHFSKRSHSLSLSQSLSLTQSHSHTFTLSSILSLTHSLTHALCSLSLSPSLLLCLSLSPTFYTSVQLVSGSLYQTPPSPLLCLQKPRKQAVSIKIVVFSCCLLKLRLNTLESTTCSLESKSSGVGIIVVIACKSSIRGN